MGVILMVDEKVTLIINFQALGEQNFKTEVYYSHKILGMCEDFDYQEYLS